MQALDLKRDINGTKKKKRRKEGEMEMGVLENIWDLFSYITNYNANARKKKKKNRAERVWEVKVTWANSAARSHTPMKLCFHFFL